MNRARLSVIFLTKNESEHIEAAIQSVDFADEVLVFDSGSTDSTRALALSLRLQNGESPKVIENPLWQGYGKARHDAEKHARHPWVLMLDADERVTPALKEAILRFLAQKGDTPCVGILSRQMVFFGKPLCHGGAYPDRVARLYQRAYAHFSPAQKVHESLQYKKGTRTFRFRAPLLHYSYRSLSHFVMKMDAYGRAWAESRIERRRIWLIEAPSHALTFFVQSYFLRLGFLDGAMGLLYALCFACSVFLKYSHLYLLQRRRTAPRRGKASHSEREKRGKKDRKAPQRKSERTPSKNLSIKRQK